MEGETVRVIRPRDVAAARASELAKKRAYGHTVAVVETEPDDVGGLDRVREVVPGLSATETVPVLLDADAAIEAGDHFEGEVRQATIETTVHAHVPVDGDDEVAA